MKRIFSSGKYLTFIFLIYYYPAYSQDKFRCDCTEFNIDALWSSSNGVNCYKIPVLQIYNSQDKRQKTIAVIKAESTGPSKLEPLLYLHGGPGIATLDNAQRYLNNDVWKSLRKKHDIIMMDYSGTGFSEPFLCEEILDSIKNLKHTTLSHEERKEKLLQLTMQCRESLVQDSIDINTYTSVQLAADADAVRKALGIRKWQIYGVSYGTLVAMMSVRHFPDGVERVLLDSPVPPNAMGFDFVQTMDETLHNLHNKLLQNPKTSIAFPDIISDFTTTADRLNKQPLKIEGAEFTGNDFAWAMMMTFYKTEIVRLIPLALKEFAAGNDTLLLKWLSVLNKENQYGRTNEFQNRAITCYECKPRFYYQTPQALERKFPHLKSLAGKEFMEICYIFRPEYPDPSFYEPLESDIPVLILSGEFDPGTPPSFARSTAEKLRNASIIIAPGASHAVINYNNCILSISEDFFEKLPNIESKCMEDVKTIEFVLENINEELAKISKLN